MVSEETGSHVRARNAGSARHKRSPFFSALQRGFTSLPRKPLGENKQFKKADLSSLLFLLLSFLSFAETSSVIYAAHLNQLAGAEGEKTRAERGERKVSAHYCLTRGQKGWSHFDLTFISVPDRQHSEDEGTEGGSEETSPVVPHGEEGGGYLDAEQDT